jgi:hypothetical protein
MSNRQERPSNSQQRNRIAALAARLLAEDGISELGTGQTQGGTQPRLAREAQLMPDDNEVEAELTDLSAAFPGTGTAGEECQHLLRTAARLMAIMQPFQSLSDRFGPRRHRRPHAEIDIQLFPTVPRRSKSSCSTSASTTATARLAPIVPKRF